jgi:MFS transporter, NNP family, nitrate/nitrite transporter
MRSKVLSDDYTHNIGVISGVMALAGDMGGFILSIMFGALVDLTGVRSSALSRRHPLLSHFT